MSLGDLFKLAKLTIEPYRDVDRREAAGDPHEVQYNPESLTIRHENVFQGMQGVNTSSARAVFSHSKSKDLSVDLVFDGTGVGYFGVELLGDVKSVHDRVEELLEACYALDGDIHEPHYLRLRWGNEGVLGKDFDCRLASVDITYSSFDRDGSPLHAEISARFVEDLSPERKAATDRKSSPDLTHRRLVVAGDTLTLLCREIYGSSEHYLRVAEVNGLDDVRELVPGQELLFPPFDRRGGC